MSKPFWKKPLEELSSEEWEALCDGCGRCCLVKLEDEDTGRVYYTEIGCVLLDASSCRCRDYSHRQAKVSDCIRLTLSELTRLPWLPPTCAYRLRRDGKDLAPWHPLVSGDPDSVHKAGVSVRGKVRLREDEASDADYVDLIVAWPEKWPRRAAKIV